MVLIPQNLVSVGEDMKLAVEFEETGDPSIGYKRVQVSVRLFIDGDAASADQIESRIRAVDAFEMFGHLDVVGIYEMPKVDLVVLILNEFADHAKSARVDVSVFIPVKDGDFFVRLAVLIDLPPRDPIVEEEPVPVAIEQSSVARSGDKACCRAAIEIFGVEKLAVGNAAKIVSGRDSGTHACIGRDEDQRGPSLEPL